MEQTLLNIFKTSFGFILTAMCWGSTNPFIKKGTEGLETVKKDNWILQIIFEFIFLFSRWQYVVPLVLNLSGSAVYYYTLSGADITTAVPVVNSLALVFTQATESIFMAKKSTKNDIIGMSLIILGVALCIQE
ncbi:hypothetical protein BB559_003333 [Furculomyces boomerangus]|uniref:EamA domain-containing protein n=2 Tax=Harpellales TaxID=61421 RepID=A0A2T9YLW6_9FUNG|nr:hypothetical protein BB559_005036 [Furculomyces boomerangus]PVU93328.1 hypothetical protein BB559_003333 [Furculomyces boomerangus]PWA03330.1 hypothetical protein BB558_000521 [Smittium angustum]